MGATAIQALIFASFISLALCATIMDKDGKDEEGVVAASGFQPPLRIQVPIVEPQFPPSGLYRAKRYIGYGRRPGMRYSKASSVFDFDNTFNRIYNKYEKRGQYESPISNFRELRMKQKVPNAQVLLPHLFNRNNRGSELDGQQRPGDVVDLSEDDLDALMLLLEEYAAAKQQNVQHNNEQ